MISLKDICDSLNRRFKIVPLNDSAKNSEHIAISSVTIMETTNVEQWVKGGELILTSSSTFPQNRDQLSTLFNLLGNLHAACIAIKLIDLDNLTLEEMESIAEKIDFPILLIPTEVTYLEIMNYINSLLFNIKEYNDFRERAAYNIIFSNGKIDSLIIDSFKSYDIDIMSHNCLVANFNFISETEDNRINLQFDDFFKNVQLMCSNLINSLEISEYLFVRQLNSFTIIFLGSLEQLENLDLNKQLENAFQQFSDILKIIQIGLSNIEHIGFIPLLIEQSKFALSFTNLETRQGYLESYSNIEFYHMIYNGIGENLETFLTSTLKSVRKGTALYDTVLTYFKCNENLQETSKLLFIHINTLNYRLKRVQNITGLNLSITQNKVKLYLAVIAEDSEIKEKNYDK